MFPSYNERKRKKEKEEERERKKEFVTLDSKWVEFYFLLLYQLTIDCRHFDAIFLFVSFAIFSPEILASSFGRVNLRERERERKKERVNLRKREREKERVNLRRERERERE